MKIAIGSDRRGYVYKTEIIKHLSQNGYIVKDLGPYDCHYPVDYPIYGKLVGEEVSNKTCDKGIVICATGIGIMIACNKINGVRCGIGYTDEVAKLMRQHNDANVIAFGQDYMELNDVLQRVDIFLETDFLADYHRTRIKQITDIENGIDIYQTPYINIK